MTQYDYSLLLGKMREHKFTQEKAAKAIGISETSLNLTLNNKRNFRQSEILTLCSFLNIPVSKIDKYFFSQIL